MKKASLKISLSLLLLLLSITLSFFPQLLEAGPCDAGSGKVTLSQPADILSGACCGGNSTPQCFKARVVLNVGQCWDDNGYYYKETSEKLIRG